MSCYVAQALYNFTEWQLKEISALGNSNSHLPADQAEHLGLLAKRTKEMANDIHQRLEKLRQVHQWMMSFQRLHTATSRRLQEVFICLQKASIYRDPLWLAQAGQLCEVCADCSSSYRYAPFVSYNLTHFYFWAPPHFSFCFFFRRANANCVRLTSRRPSCNVIWSCAQKMA